MGISLFKKHPLMVGIAIGLIAPFVVILIQYYLKSKLGWDWNYFWQSIKGNKIFLTGVSSFALVANGLIFGILIQFKKFHTAKGVFIPTVILSIAVLLYKLIG
jgi:hypothetical protein